MRQRIQASPAVENFLAVLNPEKTAYYLKEIQTRMENGMNAAQLENEICFLKMDRAMRKRPFADENDLVEFANMIHAYTTQLTTVQIGTSSLHTD